MIIKRFTQEEILEYINTDSADSYEALILQRLTALAMLKYNEQYTVKK